MYSFTAGLFVSLSGTCGMKLVTWDPLEPAPFTKVTSTEVNG